MGMLAFFNTTSASAITMTTGTSTRAITATILFSTAAGDRTAARMRRKGRSARSSVFFAFDTASTF